MNVKMGMLLLTGLLVAADDAKDATKKELAKFTGTWKIESVEVDGNKPGAEVFKDWKLVIKDDQFTFHDGKMTTKGQFKVDVTKKPKTIDITFTDGPEKGQTLIGIYELEGDTYKVCLSMNKDRPKELASKAGSGHILEVFKRQKP